MIRPTLSQKTIDEISKRINIPIELPLEKSLIIFIERFDELQKQIEDLQK